MHDAGPPRLRRRQRGREQALLRSRSAALPVHGVPAPALPALGVLVPGVPALARVQSAPGLPRAVLAGQFAVELLEPVRIVAAALASKRAGPA